MIVALLLMSATVGGAGWHASNGWGLGLRQIERGTDVIPVDLASAPSARSRGGATFEWMGAEASIVEHVEVAPEVAQELRVEQAPEGAGPLRLVFDLPSGWSLSAIDERAVRICSQEGGPGGVRPGARTREPTCHEWGGLAAWDDAGRALAVEFEVRDGQLVYSVDDAGARYPLLVDPVLTQSFTRGSDQTGSDYGYALAAGDVNGDGYADLVVGAPGWDSTAGADAGRVLVYHGRATGLVTPAAWSVSGAQAGQSLGFSVAVADVDGDGFGDLIAGAPFYDDGANLNVGRIVVWRGGSSGLSTASVFSAPGAGNLGYSLAAAGDVNGDNYGDVIMGSPEFDGPETDEGLVSILYGSATGLSLSSGIAIEGNQAGARAGSSVAGVGDVNNDGFDDVAFGLPFYDGGETDEGAIRVYRGASTGPVFFFGIESNQAGAEYGSSVAAAGDVNGDGRADVLIGARMRDAGLTDEGVASLYLGATGGLTLPAAWSASGGQANAHFGRAVAGLGDVNGDGYADIAAGAPDFDDPDGNEGVIRVFLGSPSGPAASASWQLEGGQAGAWMGAAIVGLGDADGDGFSDVAVAARGYDGDVADEGVVLALHGSSATAPTANAGAVLTATAGSAVSPSGASFGDPDPHDTHRCTWDWGDGSANNVLDPCAPGTAGAVSHTYAAAGSYTVRLTVADGDGQTATDTTTVQVTGDTGGPGGDNGDKGGGGCGCSLSSDASTGLSLSLLLGGLPLLVVLRRRR